MTGAASIKGAKEPNDCDRAATSGVVSFAAGSWSAIMTSGDSAAAAAGSGGGLLRGGLRGHRLGGGPGGGVRLRRRPRRDRGPPALVAAAGPGSGTWAGTSGTVAAGGSGGTTAVAEGGAGRARARRQGQTRSGPGGCLRPPPHSGPATGSAARGVVAEAAPPPLPRGRGTAGLRHGRGISDGRSRLPDGT